MLTSANGQPMPAEVYVRIYLDETTGDFHGVAQVNTVQLDQELTGGEAGAGNIRYEYARDAAVKDRR